MQKIKLKTVLFDMDDVAIDSEKLHLRAMGLTLEQHDIEYAQYNMPERTMWLAVFPNCILKMISNE